MTNLQKLIGHCLLSRGWQTTNNAGVFTKNSCYLYTDKKSTTVAQTSSFTYSQGDIQDIMKASYNVAAANLQKPVKGPSDCINPKTDYFVVKNGWVLVKGKYENGTATLSEQDLVEHPEFKSVQAFNDMIAAIDDAAERDYIALRGIKQRCYTRYKKENSFKYVPNGQSIVEGCFVQIQKNSNRSSLFKEGACFKIVIITDEVIIVTAVKNGSLTNNNYEIESHVILEEALSKNLVAVDIVPEQVDVAFESWESFSSEDVASKLPESITQLITSDAQKAAVMEAFARKLNITPLLNDDIAEDAFTHVLDMVKAEYVHPTILNLRVRESVAKIWAHYALVGLEPDRFLDDSFDQFSLEECIQEEIVTCNRYRESLMSKNLAEDVVDLLYKYRFKTGKELEIICNEGTRWQFLLPYLLQDSLSKEMMNYFAEIIKMYASLTNDGCYLKAAYLSAEGKGAILNYFKAPFEFKFLDGVYSEVLTDLLNSPIRIAFDRKGISLKGDMYSLCRDIDSIYVRTVTNRVVWRCYFINEEAVISHDSDVELYF